MHGQQSLSRLAKYLRHYKSTIESLPFSSAAFSHQANPLLISPPQRACYESSHSTAKDRAKLSASKNIFISGIQKEHQSQFKILFISQGYFKKPQSSSSAFELKFMCLKLYCRKIVIAIEISYQILMRRQVKLFSRIYVKIKYHVWLSALLYLNRQYLNIMYEKLDKTSKDKWKVLLGGLLIKFGTGGLTVIGIYLPYYLSYLAIYQQISPTLYANTLTVITIGLGLICSVSIQLCTKFGFLRTIRATCLLFGSLIFISSFVTSKILFLCLSLVFPAFLLGLSSVPIIYCLWSQFPQAKNKVSGYIFFTYSISGVIYVFLFDRVVNPENLPPNNNLIFPPQVAINVPSVLRIMGLLSSLTTITGSMLIDCDENSIPKQQSLNLAQLPILSKDFLILFIDSLCVSFYFVYFNVNYKPIIYRIEHMAAGCQEDINCQVPFSDNFMNMLYIGSTVVSTISALLWGYLADSDLRFKSLLLLLMLIFAGSSVLLVMQPSVFQVFILSNSLIDKGLAVILGPGLISLFGLQVGSKLYSLKLVAYCLALFGVTIVMNLTQDVYYVFQVASFSTVFFFSISLFLTAV